MHVFSTYSISTALLALLLPCHGIVNHLPPDASSQIERQQAGLDRSIGEEFGGVESFPYWDHVGKVGMGSGIYLGEGRVLTSAHVGCFPFQMHDGSVYQPDYTSWRLLKNADGSKSDLAVFEVRFEKTSQLARLGVLRVSTSHAERPMLLVGTGYTQGAKPISLGSQGRTLAVLGYHVQPQRSIAWGLNRTSQKMDGPLATGGTFSTHCFTTRFEPHHFAGQAAEGDSGGAGFSYNRELNRWELSGCIIAVSQQQPSVTFGARTYLGDLNSYARQIAGVEGGGTDQPMPKKRATLQKAVRVSSATAHAARASVRG